MPLKFNGVWRWESPGSISDDVVRSIYELVSKVATQGDRQQMLEHFKTYFANAAGKSSSWSSSESWAESDLYRDMGDAAENAPLFVEAFYDACEALRDGKEFAAPDVNTMNRLLAPTGYQIRPPNLVSSADTNAFPPVSVPRPLPSLDDQAREMIQSSLSHSEDLLSEGTKETNRRAVQELLWLLETISTAFRGLKTDAGTVQGKYFNKIVADLQRLERGKTLGQVLDWAVALHGYLSSPTGGGIRHGADLADGVALEATEARLFCNLIRSYISFLLAEHDRLTRAGKKSQHR